MLEPRPPSTVAPRKDGRRMRDERRKATQLTQQPTTNIIKNNTNIIDERGTAGEVRQCGDERRRRCRREKNGSSEGEVFQMIFLEDELWSELRNIFLP